MATPAAGEFIISQGDSLPLMRIPVPANTEGELVDPTGCTVNFLGRKAGTRVFPSPIVRAIESFASETHDFGDGAVPVVAFYVHLTKADTLAIDTGGQDFVEMEGELEIIDGADTLTIGNNIATQPGFPYLRWWIRDDIGTGAA